MTQFACPRCKKTRNIIREQRFKNGKTHLRQECALCGQFIKWAVQDVQGLAFKSRLFRIVKELARANSIDQVYAIKNNAKVLMEEVGHGEKNSEVL